MMYGFWPPPVPEPSGGERRRAAAGWRPGIIRSPGRALAVRSVSVSLSGRESLHADLHRRCLTSAASVRSGVNEYFRNSTVPHS